MNMTDNPHNRGSPHLLFEKDEMVLLLIFGETFLVEYRDFTFVLHRMPPSNARQTGSCIPLFLWPTFKAPAGIPRHSHNGFHRHPLSLRDI